MTNADWVYEQLGHNCENADDFDYEWYRQHVLGAFPELFARYHRNPEGFRAFLYWSVQQGHLLDGGELSQDVLDWRNSWAAYLTNEEGKTPPGRIGDTQAFLTCLNNYSVPQGKVYSPWFPLVDKEKRDVLFARFGLATSNSAGGRAFLDPSQVLVYAIGDDDFGGSFDIAAGTVRQLLGDPNSSKLPNARIFIEPREKEFGRRISRYALEGNSATGALAIGLHRLWSPREMNERIYNETVASFCLDPGGKCRTVGHVTDKHDEIVSLKWVSAFVVAEDDAGALTNKVKGVNSLADAVKVSTGLASEIEKYLDTVKRRCSNMAVGSTKMSLENVYVDMNVNYPGKSRSGAETEKPENVSESWDHLLVRIIHAQQPQTALLLGNAGSGKSTALRHAALVWTKQACPEDRIPIPVFVPLAELAKSLDRPYDDPYEALRPYINRTLGGGENAELHLFLGEALKTNSAVLLLDGLDEVVESPELSGWFQNTEEWKCHRFVTCRSSEFSTSKIGNPPLKKYSLNGFDSKQMEAYFNRYSQEAGADQQTGEDALSRLKTRMETDATLSEICSVPLMLAWVSQLALRGDLPADTTRTALLRAIEELLLTDKTGSEGLEHGPVLEQLAWRTFTREDTAQRYRFGRNTARKIIGDAIGKPENSQEVKDIIKAFIACGLLKHEGNDIQFPHAIIQEFLAAKFLASQFEDGSAWHSNVVFGVGGREQRIVADVVDRKSCDPTYESLIIFFAGELAEIRHNRPGVDADLIRLLDILSTDNYSKDDIFRHRLALAVMCLPELANGSGKALSQVVDRITNDLWAFWSEAILSGSGRGPRAGQAMSALATAMGKIASSGLPLGKHCLQLLSSADPADHGLAIKTVVAAGPSVVVPGLREALFNELRARDKERGEDKDFNVVRALASAKLAVSTEDELRVLIGLSDDLQVYGCKEEFGRVLAWDSVSEFFPKLLQDPDPYTRYCAISGIEAVGEAAANTEVVRKLACALTDTTHYVAEAATDAICSLGEKALTPEIAAAVLERFQHVEPDMFGKGLGCLEIVLRICRDNITSDVADRIDYLLRGEGGQLALGIFFAFTDYPGVRSFLVRRLPGLLREVSDFRADDLKFLFERILPDSITPEILVPLHKSGLFKLLGRSSVESWRVQWRDVLVEMLMSGENDRERAAMGMLIGHGDYKAAPLLPEDFRQSVALKLVEKLIEKLEILPTCSAAFVEHHSDAAISSELTELLCSIMRDQDAKKRAYAAYLVKILGKPAANPAVLGAIETLLGDENRHVRSEAREAVIKLGEHAATHGIIRELTRSVTSVNWSSVTSDNWSVDHAHAVEAVTSIGPAAASPELVSKLAEIAPIFLRCCWPNGWILWRIALLGPGATEAAVSSMTMYVLSDGFFARLDDSEELDSEELDFESILKGLLPRYMSGPGTTHYGEIIERLHLISLTIRSLGDVAWDPQITTRAQRALRSPDRDVRIGACLLLAAIRADLGKALSVLLKSLRDTDTRPLAVFAISFVGDAAGAPAIVKLLELLVWHAVTNHLNELHDLVDAVESLGEAAYTPDMMNTLGSILLFSSNPDDNGSTLYAMLDRQVRTHAAKILVKAGEKAVSPATAAAASEALLRYCKGDDHYAFAVQLLEPLHLDASEALAFLLSNTDTLPRLKRARLLEQIQQHDPDKTFDTLRSHMTKPILESYKLRAMRSHDGEDDDFDEDREDWAMENDPYELSLVDWVVSLLKSLGFPLSAIALPHSQWGEVGSPLGTAISFVNMRMEALVMLGLGLCLRRIADIVPIENLCPPIEVLQHRQFITDQSWLPTFIEKGLKFSADASGTITVKHVSELSALPAA